MILKASELSQHASTTKKLGRVLHIINGEHYSGAERVQDLLARQLPEMGFDVGFLCLKSGLFEANRQSRSAPITTVEMKSKFDNRPAKRVIELVRSEGYTILHAHTPRSLMVGASAVATLKMPLVYHVHSPVGRDSKRWMANKVNTLVENYFLRRVSKMICVSSSLKKYMLSLGHADDRLVVVPNGVPVVSTPPIKKPQDDFVLGMVALFRPRKGTEVLLEALAILRKRNIRVRLLAVGPFETKEYQQQIHSLAAQLGVAGQIEWTGFTKDVTAQLQRMHAMVLPSLFGEGLPMVVLEAMASGLPVIASQVEGIPEAIRDGVDGLLFEAANPAQLADQILAMKSDLNRWEQMGTSARERHRECLSDVAMATKIAAVYQSL
ncbi:MAG: glycosyltransferase [Pirellulaceae bacterium]